MVNNTKYGSGALQNNTGSNNTAIGAYAAYNNLDASSNTAVGSISSHFNTTGQFNTALGSASLCRNTTGSRNIAVGSNALGGQSGQSVGDENVAVGVQALFVNPGNSNTAIGTYAALGVTDSSYNTFLGAYTTFDDVTSSYQYSTAIGYGAQITNSNQIMMGGTGAGSYPNVVIPGKAFLPNFDFNTATETQIVPKEYVDAASQGLAPKAPCKCVATDGVTIGPTGIYIGSTYSSLYTIDGYATNVGDRVLINNQGPTGPTGTIAGINNGIYIVSGPTAGPYQWDRSTDMPNNSDAVGAYTFVENGTVYKATTWVQNVRGATGSPVLVGATGIYFVKTGGFPFRIGRGLDTSTLNSNIYINVDTSLNFINYLDSTSGAIQPGGATGGSGTLNIGNNTTQTIIGPTGGTGNPVIFPSGITGPTGSFNNLYVATKAQFVQDISVNSITIGLGGGQISSNTVVGYQALSSNTSTGIRNTAVGQSSLYANTTGINNTAIGQLALLGNTGGSNNTAVGQDSLPNNYGGNNTALGQFSLYANTTGYNNTAIGQASLDSNITGYNNTAVGCISLSANNGGICNTTIGYNSGADFKNGSFNTFLGASTDVDVSSNNYNYSTAIGYGAVVDASNQIMLGGTGAGSYPQVVAPGGITGATGSFNNLYVATKAQFVQDISVNSITIGLGGGQDTSNTVVGNLAFVTNISGQNNTAIGYEALGNNTSGIHNTAVGSGSLADNQTGNNNTAVGDTSLQNNIGSYNTAVGFSSLITNTSGQNNTAIGVDALQINQTGSSNTAIGLSAGSYNTTGSNNTFLGAYSNANGNNYQYSTAIGVGAVVDASNQIMLGGLPSGGIYPQVVAPGGITGATGSFNGLNVYGNGYFSGDVTANNFPTPSDYRIKENIIPLNETFIVDKLVPVTYKNLKTDKQDIGLIAHELQEHFPYLVNGEKDGENLQTVNYTGLIGILIKEVKDLKERVTSLENKSI